MTFNPNVTTVVGGSFLVTAVPEPATGLMRLAVGIPAVLWLRRRRASTVPAGQSRPVSAVGLPGFADDPERSGEKILGAIRQAGIDEAE